MYRKINLFIFSLLLFIIWNVGLGGIVWLISFAVSGNLNYNDLVVYIISITLFTGIWDTLSDWYNRLDKIY